MIAWHAEGIEIAAALCRHFEGFYPNPHLCPRGIPTIGIGATLYPDGRAVTLRDRHISREFAERMMLDDLRSIRLPAVLRLCPTLDTPERLGAILSWVFNLGESKLRSSTMRKRILSSDWDAVPMQIRRWKYAGPKELPGLKRRRNAEALVFMDWPRAQAALPYMRRAQVGMLMAG